MSRTRRNGFTLVELLVVIGIIALLISILLPSLSKARQSAITAQCLSNLRQMGTAFVMYANENNGYLPFPTTSHIITVSNTVSIDDGEVACWFDAVDPYLAGDANTARSGVAGQRVFSPYKQCPIYKTFVGQTISGQSQTSKEIDRTYKMNTHLRHPRKLPSFSGERCKITEARPSAQFALIGDSQCEDTVGFESVTTGDNGKFSFEVNDVNNTNSSSPALRHSGGANIAFLDGHAEHAVLKTKERTAMAPKNTLKILSWESEYIDSGGNPVKPSGTSAIESQNLQRNPNMPFYWSDPPNLYEGA